MVTALRRQQKCRNVKMVRVRFSDLGMTHVTELVLSHFSIQPGTASFQIYVWE